MITKILSCVLTVIKPKTIASAHFVRGEVVDKARFKVVVPEWVGDLLFTCASINEFEPELVTFGGSAARFVAGHIKPPSDLDFSFWIPNLPIQHNSFGCSSPVFESRFLPALHIVATSFYGNPDLYVTDPKKIYFKRVYANEHWVLYKFFKVGEKPVEIKFFNSKNPGNIVPFTNHTHHIDITDYVKCDPDAPIHSTTVWPYSRAELDFLSGHSLIDCVKPVSVKSNHWVDEDKLQQLVIAAAQGLSLYNTVHEPVILFAVFKYLASTRSPERSVTRYLESMVAKLKAHFEEFPEMQQRSIAYFGRLVAVYDQQLQHLGIALATVHSFFEKEAIPNSMMSSLGVNAVSFDTVLERMDSHFSSFFKQKNWEDYVTLIETQLVSVRLYLNALGLNRNVDPQGLIVQFSQESLEPNSPATKESVLQQLNALQFVLAAKSPHYVSKCLPVLREKLEKAVKGSQSSTSKPKKQSRVSKPVPAVVSETHSFSNSGQVKPEPVAAAIFTIPAITSQLEFSDTLQRYLDTGSTAEKSMCKNVLITALRDSSELLDGMDLTVLAKAMPLIMSVAKEEPSPLPVLLSIRRLIEHNPEDFQKYLDFLIGKLGVALKRHDNQTLWDALCFCLKKQPELSRTLDDFYTWANKKLGGELNPDHVSFLEHLRPVMMYKPRQPSTVQRLLSFKCQPPDVVDKESVPALPRSLLWDAVVWHASSSKKVSDFVSQFANDLPFEDIPPHILKLPGCVTVLKSCVNACQSVVEVSIWIDSIDRLCKTQPRHMLDALYPVASQVFYMLDSIDLSDKQGIRDHWRSLFKMASIMNDFFPRADKNDITSFYSRVMHVVADDLCNGDFSFASGPIICFIDVVDPAKAGQFMRVHTLGLPMRYVFESVFEKVNPLLFSALEPLKGMPSDPEQSVVIVNKAVPLFYTMLLLYNGGLITWFNSEISFLNAAERSVENALKQMLTIQRYILNILQSYYSSFKFAVAFFPKQSLDGFLDQITQLILLAGNVKHMSNQALSQLQLPPEFDDETVVVRAPTGDAFRTELQHSEFLFYRVSSEYAASKGYLLDMYKVSVVNVKKVLVLWNSNLKTIFKCPDFDIKCPDFDTGSVQEWSTLTKAVKKTSTGTNSFHGKLKEKLLLLLETCSLFASMISTYKRQRVDFEDTVMPFLYLTPLFFDFTESVSKVLITDVKVAVPKGYMVTPAYMTHIKVHYGFSKTLFFDIPEKVFKAKAGQKFLLKPKVFLGDVLFYQCRYRAEIADDNPDTVEVFKDSNGQLQIRFFNNKKAVPQPSGATPPD